MEVLKRIALRYEVPAARMRRRRKWVVLAVLGLGGVAASTLTGGDGRHGLGAALADPLSVFAARSPGERTEGALTQTKGVLPTQRRRAGGPPTVPRERVLSEVRTRPPIPFAGIAAPFDFAPIDTPGGFGPLGRTGSGDGFPIPPGGAGSIPDSGGGTGGTGPNPPVVPAVPEPGTWATMILGFLAMATMIRGGTRRAASRAAATRTEEAMRHDPRG